ncbi:MAG: serine/threonine-protein kinase HipA [Gammaproteobacteria bacterium]|jgi:serine/threonine-protein kinase HipA
MMLVQVRRIYQFPELHPRSFYRMPGLIAGSLPDKYGQQLLRTVIHSDEAARFTPVSL